MRYLIKISYDGSKFYGFQRQKDKNTIQGAIEEALKIINKSPVVIKGAGRTDAGVHANGQYAHFDLDVMVPPERLKDAINSLISDYIYIKECFIVDSDFHARYKALRKKYVYKIWLGEYDPKKVDYYLFYNHEVDLEKLKECANLFIGKHNFQNFVSGERLNCNSTIHSIEFVKDKDILKIEFVGKGFYRYMIRNLVGAMLWYNENKCDINTINTMLNDENCDKILPTAKANGLYLEGVDYET